MLRGFGAGSRLLPLEPSHLAGIIAWSCRLTGDQKAGAELTARGGKGNFPMAKRSLQKPVNFLS
jgi:hypothetical protein